MLCSDDLITVTCLTGHCAVSASGNSVFKCYVSKADSTSQVVQLFCDGYDRLKVVKLFHGYDCLLATMLIIAVFFAK